MNLFIMGDSHTFRLRTALPSDLHIKECYWEEGNPMGYDKSLCPDNHIQKSKPEHLPIEVIFSGHKGGGAFNSFKFLNETHPCIKKIVNEDTIILPFFGYIDCKTHLVFHKDTEKCVEKYMQGFLNFFPKNKIRFIEPMPQFINNLGTGYPIYDFKDRYPYYKEFVECLREKSKIMGLEDPISPEKIFGVDKFDESYECHDCEICLYPENKDNRLDHLKEKFYKKMLYEIVEEYGDFLDD